MDHKKKMVKSPMQKAKLLKTERTSLHVSLHKLVEKQSRKSSLVLRLCAWHDYSWVLQRKVASLRRLQLQKWLKAMVALCKKKLDTKVLKLQSLKRSLSTQVLKQTLADLWSQKTLLQSDRQLKVLLRHQRQLKPKLVRQSSLQRTKKATKLSWPECVQKLTVELQRQSKSVTKKR